MRWAARGWRGTLLAAGAAIVTIAAAAGGLAAWRQPPSEEPSALGGAVVPRVRTGSARPAASAGAADPGNVPYDGRFTFARIRFDPPGGGASFWGRVDRKWDHDFPRAEHNFARILRELTTMRPYMEGGNVFAADDPELFRHPVAYLCEPGYWEPTDQQAAALRAYLTKGGFLIFDDFFGAHWINFERQLQKVLPGGKLVRLDASHPVFDAFYRIESLDMRSYRRSPPEFWGVFEDNDPSKRLMVIANYNNDLGESWEWSDEGGVMPLDVTNAAYKLGVNYVVYAMTH